MSEPEPREVTKVATTWDARDVSGHHHGWDAWDAGVIQSGPAKISISAAQDAVQSGGPTGNPMGTKGLP